MAVALSRPDKPEDWERFAQLCLTYSDAPGDQVVPVQLGQGDRRWQIKVAKLSKEVFRQWMI
jgi:hypothetical protein